MMERGPLRRLRPRRLTFLPAVTPSQEQQLPPSEIRRGMRLSISEGVFAQMWGVVTVGTFVTGLALQLGAGNFELGLMAALPVAAQLVQLFAAWWVERRGSRRFIAVASSYGRLFWIIPPILLFVPMEQTVRLGLSILAMAVAWGMLAISTNAWLNWMSDLIPANLRGRFFGTRNTVLALVSIVTISSAGALIDFARSQGEINTGYLLLYSVASVAGVISSIIVSRQPEPPMKRTSGLRVGSMLMTPLRDARFRVFMLTMIVWGSFVNLGSPFFAAHALKNIPVSFQELASMDVLTAAVSILSQPYWGRLADRVGHKRVLSISMIGAAPLALTWLFVTHDSVWLLYLNAIAAGIFWPGLGLALNNRLMERAPNAGRGSYLAAYSAITGLSAFLASLLGGVITDVAQGVQLHLGPLVLNNYQIVFMAAGLGRLLVALVGRRNL